MKCTKLNKSELLIINGGDKFLKDLGYLWGRTHGAVVEFFDNLFEGPVFPWPG